MKQILYAFLLISLFFTLFTQTRVIAVSPTKNPVETILEGKNWHYTVPFKVENKDTIEQLIQCESQGVNIARMDSNKKMSWGILQFNGTSTWDGFAALANVTGTGPMFPASAIKVADWMISHGYLKRWTCAKILGLY